MPSRSNNALENDHRPARSGTPTAWMALALLSALIAGWLFFDIILCGVIQLGLSAIAWNQHAALSLNHLSITDHGSLQAQGVKVAFGPRDHRSSWKSDWIEVRLPSLDALLGLGKNKQSRWIQEFALGKSSILLDHRGESQGLVSGEKKPHVSFAIPWLKLLPASSSAGPLEIVVIGENYRAAVSGLTYFLPNRWAGKIVYSKAELEVGSSFHQVFYGATAPADWNGSTLRLGKLGLTTDLHLEELTLTPRSNRLEFGLRGSVGEGLLRGDGAFGMTQNSTALEATLVGENLQLGSLATLLDLRDQRAAGMIRQARFTFRGDLGRPLEADSSLRLVADSFRWEGRGWDSLKLAATLTGRVLTLSELQLLQQENEVVAEGVSRLPEDWHAALKAPFTATFHATLNDAGALAALAGPSFAQLSGGLFFEGAIKGAENKAEGYCNLLGTEMKLRNLPLDWVKGCLLFEGKNTRLNYLEAWSGKDRIVMEGEVQNSMPHTYSAKAQFGVANLTKRLAQLGVSTAAQIGGGAVQGNWDGDGSSLGHSGTFQAKVTDWISPWTVAGMSGSFEGSYSPGHFYCSKAEFQQQDLQLSFEMAASPTRLEAKSIVATRKGKPDPLVQGEISLPVNAPALWQSGDLVTNLIMADPLNLRLTLHGIKAEELADLLGQKIPFTGTLEGELAAGGTPEIPEIHSVLQIAKLTLPDATPIMGLTCNLDAKAGRAIGALVQTPPKGIKEAPLNLRADFPFRFVKETGQLQFAETNAPIQGETTVHGFSLNGWSSFWSASSWNLRDGVLDGSLTLEGTLDKPSVKGSLLVTAREATLPGVPKLQDLQLPITCTLTKADANGGGALLGEKAISIGATLDWSTNPWNGKIDFSGKELRFPQIGTVISSGDADISLQLQETNTPILTGTLQLKSLDGFLPQRLSPFFTPPGIVLHPALLSLPESESTAPCQLNLEVKTAGWLAHGGYPAGAAAKVQAALHIQGSTQAPEWAGVIEAKDYFLELPSGRFFIPHWTLQSDTLGQQQIAFVAYGMTRLGLCSIEQNGLIQQSNLTFELSSDSIIPNAADLLLDLMRPQKPGANPSLLPQLPAWIRQKALAPLPAIGWMMRRMGRTESASLGFYGTPWGTALLAPASSSAFSESTLPIKN